MKNRIKINRALIRAAGMAQAAKLQTQPERILAAIALAKCNLEDAEALLNSEQSAQVSDTTKAK